MLNGFPQSELVREQEKANKREARVGFYGRVSEVTSCHLCCIVFVAVGYSVQAIRGEAYASAQRAGTTANLSTHHVDNIFHSLIIFLNNFKWCVIIFCLKGSLFSLGILKEKYTFNELFFITLFPDIKLNYICALSYYF